jgi:L-ribulokinase
MTRTFTIGVDFGTNSARAIVADRADGRIAGTHVFDYPSGEHGVLLDPHDPHLARQHPADYLEGLRASIGGALADAERSSAGFSRDRVIGIGIATTGSTPLPIDAQARPLALDPRWTPRLAAHAWLWKDHTAADQAAAITRAAREHAPYLLAPIGGTYSSEWFWSKVWRCLIVAPDVFDAAASWVELADFLPATLAGIDHPRDIVRCVCAAGHKALYSEEWGGLPPADFLARLDPKLAALRDRLYTRAYAPDRPAGTLSKTWADAFGLREGLAIAMGSFDAHYGAVGAGVRTGTLVKIVGTSTCDCAIAPADKKLPDIPGICGIVNGSIMPGYYGLEAGQSAVGDLLNWFVERVCKGPKGTSDARNPIPANAAANVTSVTSAANDSGALHATLTAEAETLRPGESGLIALDWNNGNRTILVDPRLTGLIVGQTLHSSRAEIYRALIEATAFGARAIVERLKEYGAPIDRVVCCGGIAEKNPLFMQIYADVLKYPMLIAGSPQTPALGAAISASVTAGRAAGGDESFEAAQARMTMLKDRVYTPDPAASAIYDELYALYRELHDAFGGVAASAASAASGATTPDLATFMKRLLALRDRVAATASDAAPEPISESSSSGAMKERGQHAGA